MKKHTKLVQKIHRRQRLRHVTANKLTAALTVLRELRDSRSVSPRLLERAIRDLEALMAWVDRQDKQRGG